MQDSLDPSKLDENIFEQESAVRCLIPMGTTSENVIEKYGISR